MSGAIEEVSAAAAQARAASDPQNCVLLDVREPEELQLARIAGALHIPMGDIPTKLPQLDPEKEYLIFCHSGVRSYKVALFLREQGFERVRSVRGGIDAWACEVDPRVGRY